MELVCWKCGASLKDVPRPLRPSMRCPACRADLHACRMCRHYDKRYIGHCAHDQADKVFDKEQANYCTHFVPRPHAHASGADDARDRAQAELAALFGEHTPPDPEPEPTNGNQSSGSRAQHDAEALFDPAKLKPRRDTD